MPWLGGGGGFFEGPFSGFRAGLGFRVFEGRVRKGSGQDEHLNYGIVALLTTTLQGRCELPHGRLSAELKPEPSKSSSVQLLKIAQKPYMV